MEKNNYTVIHKCPKRGSYVPIDVKKIPVCPDCKFKVLNLLPSPQKFIKYTLISHIIPPVILSLLLYTNQWQPWVWIFFTTPMHVAIYFANRYLIAQNSLNFYRNLIREATNWTSRKR